ncbi:MAG: GTPase domain-containing protein [Barnesiella sp.]|nr:GTPase domain-containing protein [Barnesiella sp.]
MDFSLTSIETGMEPIIAWIWLLIPLTAGLIGIGALIAVITHATEVEGKTLGVIGMREAGKTQLYKTLQQKSYSSYQGTGTNDYEEFTFRYGDRRIKVAAGRDIGGGENYIREYYKKWIEEKDIIFFVFNACRYISEKNYAQDVKNRMDFIWRHMKNKYGSNEEIKKKLVTIGSHLDKIDKDKQNSLLRSFQQDVSGKSYSPMFHENFIVANLTEHEKLMKELIDKKIFG